MIKHLDQKPRPQRAAEAPWPQVQQPLHSPMEWLTWFLLPLLVAKGSISG